MDKCERYSSMDGCVHVDEAIVRSRKEGRAKEKKDNLKAWTAMVEKLKKRERQWKYTIKKMLKERKGTETNIITGCRARLVELREVIKIVKKDMKGNK